MIDLETVNSIKIIGQLRNKKTYFTDILDLFSTQSEEVIHHLKTAIESKDQISIYRLSHKLKGGAQSIGAIELSKKCYELEDWSNSQENTTEFKKADEILDSIQSTYQTSKTMLTKLIASS